LLTALAHAGGSAPVERGQLMHERRALPGDAIRWLQLMGKGLVAGEDGQIIVSALGRQELSARFPGEELFRSTTVRRARWAPPPAAPPPDDPVARRAALYQLKALAQAESATIDAYGQMRAGRELLPGRPDEWLGFAARGWIMGEGGTLQVAERGREELRQQWPDQAW
jgi:hypothetical protein